MQKFKRGNLVKCLQGHIVWNNKTGAEDISPEDVGRPCIIEYSYDEKFGGGNDQKYSIVWMDTGGSTAWKHENELEFVEEGGEHLFEQAAKNRKAFSERNKDLAYILPLLDKGNLNSESVLFLFDLLGYKSRFSRNGEYATLFAEWESLHGIFKHIKDSKTVEEAKKVFENPEKYKVEEVFKLFHAYDLHPC